MQNKAIKKSLEDRFKEFLDSLAEVENIDTLSLTKEQKEAKKADYFIENRRLIIELKSLETDTEYKIEKILEPHRLRPEFPDFFGGWAVHKILKYLPDGAEINIQIVDAVTSSLEQIYRKANRQIETTKQTFDLPDSQGILIILNERISVLSPEQIIYKLRKHLAKRHPEGNFQFPEVNYVLIISEAHFSPQANEVIAFPIIHMPVGIVCEFLHQKTVDFIVEKWTQFNKIPFLGNVEMNTYNDIQFKSVSQHNEDIKEFIPRHEVYRRYYRRVRYLEKYDVEYLKWFLKMVFTQFVSGLLIGATPKQKERAKFWGETFTHFIEEINIRGLDFKIFKDTIQSINFELEGRKKVVEIMDDEMHGLADFFDS